MTCERIALLRNVGQFDSVNAGAQIPLTKFSLIYAENGRGKTTLAAILRSLNSGNPELINERQRLGSQRPPHIVLTISGTPVVFEHGTWSAVFPHIEVFDDAFVAANVCSGIDIESTHRKNLHELILGAQGVSLNTSLQGHVDRIEQHNRDLQTKRDAIPAAARGALEVDDFCALAADPNIEGKTQEAKRALSAARSADAIRSQPDFAELTLPGFNAPDLNAILGRTLADLEAGAAARVRTHIRSLGDGGETWVGDGMARIPSASAGREHEICPFCAQDLEGSELIKHYRAYFSEAYDELKGAIRAAGLSTASTHGGDAQAAFERSVRVASQNRDFWRTFTDVPEINIDTAAIARSWVAAREAVLTALRTKAAAPLEAAELPANALAAIDAYEGQRTAIATLSIALRCRNPSIAIVKERAAGANVVTLAADLEKLDTIKARHEPVVAALCAQYLAEKAAKTATEALRTRARGALDLYRQTVFPAYGAAINAYLQRFNAGFRLGVVSSANTRGGSSANYSVLINNVAVELTAQDGPSFRNTLSAGDRNTLALAFFFASLDQEPLLAQKIVVIDDPMTSLDEHRSLTTVQEMRRLERRVAQMIVLSHSKPFLCELWEGADVVTRSAMRIDREGAGSTLAGWDVRQDCITDNDRNHELVARYLRASNPATERAVATALRPMLEAFMRVAYPAAFPPGTMLGHFHNICHQRLNTANQILNAADMAELRDLLDFANRYHHDTNAAWETAAINDQALTHYAGRVLRFAQRA